MQKIFPEGNVGYENNNKFRQLVVPYVLNFVKDNKPIVGVLYSNQRPTYVGWVDHGTSNTPTENQHVI
mgnify:CR=1 FL=1